MIDTESATPHVGYYVHHHGRGHWRRALTIASHLQCPVTLIGSALPLGSLPTPLHRLDLPLDTAPGVKAEHFDTLHYAPLAVDGLRQRMAWLADWMNRHWPCLLVVDVSVEVALLARLLGIPTVYIRQHGQRDDAAHRQAYASAAALLAPFPQAMESAETPPAIIQRSHYSGWLSRYPQGRSSAPRPGRILVIVGQGGTAIGREQLTELARACPDRQIRVAGLADDAGASTLPNLVPLGHLDDPRDELCQAEVVIGSAGDSLVAEVASLGCRYIAVAEARPFDEQRQQAARLDALGLAIGLAGWPAAEAWPALLGRAAQLDPAAWLPHLSADGAQQAARIIEDALYAQFKIPLPLY
jgi:predicted glycosyltransferase